MRLGGVDGGGILNTRLNKQKPSNQKIYIKNFINLQILVYICRMKTDMVLKSTDRELFGIIIKQTTKEGFLSVTDLQRAYDIGRWQWGWNERRVSYILNTPETKERMYHILNERGTIKTTPLAFTEMVEKEGLTKVLKGLGLYRTTGKGKDKAVFADPLIWFLLAMELNPMLYAKVVIWMADTLLFDRIEAGNGYRPMNSAITSVVSTPNYPLYAKAINEKVFGTHQTGMRNLASSKELRKIADIEKFITEAIKKGWLKTESDILSAIKDFNL